MFKIKLSEPQQLWLSAICSKLRGGEQVSARTLTVELRDKLPRDFDPSQIDYRLLANEDQITLLGVALLDPTNELVKKADLIISSIQNLLLRTPDIKTVGADVISQETTLPQEEVAIIFRKLMRVGYFHDSGANYGHGIDGLLTISIDKRTFDAYLKYESLQEVLDTLIDGPSVDNSASDKESLTYANQLHAKVKNLIENSRSLDEVKARIIVESADDAIKEFGSTNQEKKVELRKWKAQAELVLPPSTIEELRKRAEGELLKKSYPTSKRMRNVVLVLVGVAVILLGLGSLMKALEIPQGLWHQPRTAPKLPELMLELTNQGKEPVVLQSRGDLILWLPQSVSGGVRSIPGKYEFLAASNDNQLTLDSVRIPASSSVKASVRFLSEAQLVPILEDGSTDLELILRRESGGIIFTGQIPFTKDALQSKR